MGAATATPLPERGADDASTTTPTTDDPSTQAEGLPLQGSIGQASPFKGALVQLGLALVLTLIGVVFYRIGKVCESKFGFLIF